MSYPITADNYFEKRQPAKSEEIKNSVEVVATYITPKNDEKKGFDDRLFVSGSAKSYPDETNRSQTIKFSSVPVRNPVATIYATDGDGTLNINEATGKISNDEIDIVSVDYYAWGLDITGKKSVEITEDYGIIVVTGYEFDRNKEERTAEDETSIEEFGTLKYKIKDNHLIQDRELAMDIAETLRDSYKVNRKDVTLNWRGDIQLILNNDIEVPDYDKNGITSNSEYKIFKHRTVFDGTLRQITDGRKI